MSNKLRYHSPGMRWSAEFTNELVTIGLPNGLEIELKYDPKTGGLVVKKSIAVDDNKLVTAMPFTGNKLLIK